jgi:hypothetical protein
LAKDLIISQCVKSAGLSREFDRTLNQLERLQRMRKGQPVLPPMELKISS